MRVRAGLASSERSCKMVLPKDHAKLSLAQNQASRHIYIAPEGWALGLRP